VPYWQSAHSIPRVLSLCGRHVVEQPIPEIEVLRGRHQRREAVAVEPGKGGYLPDVQGDALEIAATLDRAASAAARVGLKLRVSADGKQAVRVWYDLETDRFGMDGVVTKQASAWAGILRDGPAGQAVTLRIFLDRSIVEVYCGGAALTGRTFSDPEALGVDLFAEDGPALLESVDVWEMQSMWDHGR
jgi:sucrose-6-phosphate hydrolase SacC (GH32 family)